MSKTIFYSFIVGTASLVLSVVMILIAVPLLGDAYQSTMFVNSVIGCYGIGSPVTYYCLRQSQKLRVANQELQKVRHELEQANAALIEKMRIDPMTGLLSREYFFDEMKDQRKGSGANSLLLIDADHFKSINDRWGHLKGDEALKKMTVAIQSAVRKGDIVGRIGGEEFAVFLPSANAIDAGEIAERIRQSVERILFVPEQGSKAHQLTVSIGGVVPLGSAELSSIMTVADKHLYEAKNAGRNRSVIGEHLKAVA
ncbi:MAG: GGDEF domain-containing protein [Salaquimonas sp.]